MSSAPQPHWTIERYLAFERESETRHEYLNGKIYGMVGGSENHILAAGNAFAALHAQLRKRPCKIYSENMRIQVRATGLYAYPDLMVVCGDPQFGDDVRDMLLNPTLIVEVLSPSTELYDRGKKFQHYRALDSLQEYVLIAQDSPRIERFLRQAGGDWLLTDVKGLDSVIVLTSIQCTLALADVYEKVVFDDTSSG